MAVDIAAPSLIESSNALIEGFSSYPLYALQLRAQLSKSAENNSDADAHAALAKSTNYTDNFTSYTGISDSSSASNGAPPLDPNDLARINADVESSKNYLTQVKVNWLESNVKTRYVMRLLDMMEDDSQRGPVMQSDNEKLEESRIQKKAVLKRVKREAEALRTQVEVTAKQLDEDLNQHVSPAIEEARQLTRQIQDMELELAMLRNSRPEDQRMTIDEANQALDEQIEALQNIAAAQEQSRSAISAQKQALPIKQREVERLAAERSVLERQEKEVRGALRNKDRRIEENCRQLVDRAALLSTALGIKSIQPHPNGEMRVVYDVSAGESTSENGRTATLAIYSDAAARRMTGARLLDSNVDIQDIVARCLVSNDLRQLVQEVLVKVG